MNAFSHTPVPLVFQRIPAAEAAAFITGQNRSVSMRIEANDSLSQVKEETRVIVAQMEQDRKDFETRVEREAEEIAERAAEKLRIKQDAINATAACAQIAAIADDYASLETWITKTIMSAVEAIVTGLPQTEHWTGMIRKALDQAKERWNLSLVCHPNDYEAVTSAIKEAEFSTAITFVHRDRTLTEGICYLKGNEDYFELNLSCQTAALASEMLSHFAAVGRRG